ncbi:hypothetical protein J4E90_008794 [Alternaria incomplexa]|uniref:uncharacterized protein n=1 Tax=Alternaria incomplexa TaxID=1187928 RepID=UPI00221FD9B0|nr:uncharacterized protein J4E90_008794 [Alternaria incomplexa]XP_051301117.1 uncharacterized protein J4E86_006997 [Alternaria arbusti]KAI4908170.1 hypothetical protein J4E90_008794 [Alternaria incomplexa]KAI4951581.1 hypothetical protein J4E86_006997 [Alternaria arbusti]
MRSEGSKMQSDTPDPQQFFTPAPTPPVNTTAPETNAMQTPKTYRRKRPPTTSRSLTVFEPRLFAVMPEAAASELINTMRLILTRGGQKKHLLELWSQRIKDILQRLDNREVVRVYNEFATAHDHREERLTYKLPVVQELEEEKEEAEKVDEAHDDIGTHGRLKRSVGEDAAADNALQKKVRFEVAQDPDVAMGGIPSPRILIPSAIEHAEPKTAMSPSPTSPVPPPSPSVSAGVACERHPHGTCTVVRVHGFEAFPVLNIQEIQADYYGSASIVAMCVHRRNNNHVTQVAASMDNGPVDFLLINDPRIIEFLGFREPPYNTLCIQPNPRLDETYQIHVQPGRASRDPNSWLVGELVSARHAYLYWLDSRQAADPKAPPTIAEAKILAPKIGRRAKDVWEEIEKCWKLEQGSNGKRYRENRMEYLGEDPRYLERGDCRLGRSMWV